MTADLWDLFSSGPPSQIESAICCTVACYITSSGYLRIINGASGSETDHILFLIISTPQDRESRNVR